MSGFDNRIALVTGTSGVGRATALRLAEDGAAVVALGIDREANDALAGQGIDVITCDVSAPEPMERAFTDIALRYVGLDIIVNCAAIHPYADLVDTTPDTFARCLAVNVGSIHLTARHGVPLMRRRGGGAIVNVSSVQGHACQKGVAAYVASKGAIHALTRAMALELAGDRIRVNSISPGSIRSPMLELAARTFDGPDADIDAVFDRFGAAHPLGRIGEPEEVAELAAFLCSERSSFCTGGDFLADGGLTAGIGVS
ncbi:MAG: SDR family oxidoreductase [Geminicoccaceae bacterium]|nr:SDR family oxidoreductase [Geminicoccaceae bacterium]